MVNDAENLGGVFALLPVGEEAADDVKLHGVNQQQHAVGVFHKGGVVHDQLCGAEDFPGHVIHDHGFRGLAVVAQVPDQLIEQRLLQTLFRGGVGQRFPRLHGVVPAEVQHAGACHHSGQPPFAGIGAHAPQKLGEVDRLARAHNAHHRDEFHGGFAVVGGQGVVTVTAHAAVAALAGVQFNLNRHTLSVVEEVVPAALIAEIALVFRVTGINDLAQIAVHAQIRVHRVIFRCAVVAFPEFLIDRVRPRLKKGPVPVAAENFRLVLSLIAFLKILPVVVFLRQQIALPRMHPLRAEQHVRIFHFLKAIGANHSIAQRVIACLSKRAALVKRV